MNAALPQNMSAFKKYHPALFARLNPVVGNLVDIPPMTADESVESRCSQIQAFLAQGMDFLYIIGIGDGQGLKRIAPLITSGNRGILIIEPNLQHFISAMSNAPLRECIADKKIFWAIGQDHWRQIEDIFNRFYCHAAAAPFIVSMNDSSDSVDPAMLDQLKRLINQRKNALLDKLKKLPETLANLNPSPVKIWSFEDLRGKQRYSTIQTALMRSWFFHLRELGYQTEYTILRDGVYYPPYFRLFRLAECEPHIIFLCNNGPAFEYMLGQEFSRSLPIPKLVWHADDPIFAEHLFARHLAADDEHYFIADHEWADTLKKYQAKNISFLPGGSTKSRRGAKRGARKCEISFVGQVRDLSAFMQKLPPSWSAYAQKVIQEKMRFPRKKFADVLSQFSIPADLPQDYMDEFKQHLLWEANTLFRAQIIKSLHQFDLHIYGNRDWLAFLPEDMARRCYKGVARYQDLFEIYRNSAINLNIHSLQTYTCMNVRDFDVPAAGGFLLSDWLPRADETYKPGFVSDLPLSEEANAEVFFYRTPGELKRLADYFLAHEDCRMRCVELARERSLSEHSYKRRAEQLAEYIERLKD